MRFVHNGRYIDILDPSTEYHPAHQATRLICFTVDPDMYWRVATNADHYYLIKEAMTFHGVGQNLQNHMLQMKNCLLPWVKLELKTLIQCLNNGIKFLSSNNIIDYNTMTEFTITDEVKLIDVMKFSALTTLKNSSRHIIRFPAKHPLLSSVTNLTPGIFDNDGSLKNFVNLQRLDINDNSRIFLGFITPEHPMASNLTELHIHNSSVKDSGLVNLTHLHTLDCRDSDVNLDFLTERHPLARTMRTLVCSQMMKNLDKFQNLKSLDMRHTFCHINFGKNHHIHHTLEELYCSWKVNIDSLRNMHNLRKLDLSGADVGSLSFITPDHPWTLSLNELNIDNRTIADDGIHNLRNLRVLSAIRNKGIKLNFLGTSQDDLLHPLCYTLEKLIIHTTRVSDRNLRNLQNLRVLNIANSDLSLAFDNPVPMYQTLDELDCRLANVEFATVRRFVGLKILNGRNTDMNRLDENKLKYEFMM